MYFVRSMLRKLMEGLNCMRILRQLCWHLCVVCFVVMTYRSPTRLFDGLS
jgi:hypothetical protein